MATNEGAVIESGTAPEDSAAISKGIGKPSDEQFVWHAKSGAQIALPPLGQLDPELDVVLQYREAQASGDGLALAASMLGCIVSDPSVSAEAAAALRRVRLSELQEMMTAWRDHSGVDLGESLAS